MLKYKSLNQAQKFFAVVALMAAFVGCGKGDSRVAQVARDNAATKPNGPIPANQSMQSVAAGAIGRFGYVATACRTPSGLPIVLERSRDWEDTLEISDRAIKETLTVDNGCEVVTNFQIMGVDAKRLVLGNRTTTVYFNGVQQNNSACDDYKPTGSGPWYYEYEATGGAFSLIYGRIADCESGEKTQDIYERN